jgi:hypothetical protein
MRGMKSAEIRAILAENPDAELAERPRAYASEVTKLRGWQESNGKWRALESHHKGVWRGAGTGRVYGPFACSQLMPVAEAEKILADRREAYRKSQEQAARIDGQRIARENDAAAVAAQLQARGIPCTSSDNGILLQPDTCRRMLEQLERVAALGLRNSD